jgi:hypothetical protein
MEVFVKENHEMEDLAEAQAGEVEALKTNEVCLGKVSD